MQSFTATGLASCSTLKFRPCLEANVIAEINLIFMTASYHGQVQTIEE